MIISALGICAAFIFRFIKKRRAKSPKVYTDKDCDKGCDKGCDKEN